MVAQDRRGGSGSWIPGLLATFWLVLAGVSGAYLYYLVTDPNAQLEKALASPSAPEAPAMKDQAKVGGLSAEEAEALTDAIKAKDQEIAKLKSEVRRLSSQVAAFDGRLKPIEKVLGPVAALPRSTAVTTSPPAGTPPEAPVQAAPAAPAPPLPPASEAAPPAEPARAPVPSPAPSEAAQPAPPGEVEERTLADVEQSQPPVPDQKPAAAAAPAPSEAEAAEPPAEAESAGAPEAAAGEDQAAAPPSPDDAAAEQSAAGPEVASDIAALVAPDIPPGTTRFGIELGTVDKQDGIRPLWRNLLTNHAALVAGLQARRIIAPDKKWRLIAGPFSSAAEAMQACALFKKANMPCEATVFAGDAL